MSPTCPTEQNAELDCTTCMRCSSICPAEVDLPEAMRLRRYLDRPRGSHRDLFLLSQKILSTSPMTPWLSPKLDVGKDDVYYFPGCLPIMDELVDPRTDFQRAANAGVALLNALGISPKIVYGCCGHDLYYSGHLDHFQRIKEDLASRVDGEVITGCAECFHALKSLHGLKAKHISEVLQKELPDLGKATNTRMNVAFHDPCRLGRYHGIYDAPRQVLASMAELKEMPSSRENALCCGVSAWLNCNAESKKQRVLRLQEANEVGADALVTSCSKCRTHLSCVYREDSYAGVPRKLPVIDLQEYVADALGIAVPEAAAFSSGTGRRIAEPLTMADLRTRIDDEMRRNLFACTTCERCRVECQFGYDATPDLEKARGLLVAMHMGTEQHESIARKVLATGNVFGEGAKISKPDPGADIVYFPGCVAQFRRRGLLDATVLVLDSLGVRYEVPEGLVCCGSVLKRTGHDLSSLVKANLKAIDGRKVVTSCAGCYSTFSRDYEGVEVEHISKLLSPRIKELVLKNVSLSVGYHDPCHLGRRMGVYDEPRNILASIPGLKLVEPGENREKARCCGGGGGVRSADKERAMKMARERMKGFDECGADVVASACPFCEINLTEATDREVVDVVELVARSLGGDAR